MSLVNMERIPLKNSKDINESMIQEFIFNNASSLGLGDLTPIQREKVQPSGGKLDLLLADDSNTRYEVEIQLGATDPSHIIRTIEYWDTERKRYPQYDHCAVIVAEEITGRFMNVISLFNGSIPLVAIQMSAWKNGKDISPTFTKVLERITPGDAEDENFVVTDRNYWENRSTAKMMKNLDLIYSELEDVIGDYDLKYNKFYVGLAKDGIAKNFISFKPKKTYIWLNIKGLKDDEIFNNMENSGLDCDYDSRWNQYRIKIKDVNEFKNHKELIIQLVKNAMEYYNAE